jgi:uncharacterized RDD family membrane protein YckC
MPHDQAQAHNAKPPPGGKPCGLTRRLASILYDSAIVIGLLMLATMISILAGFERQTAMKDPGFTFYLVLVWFTYIAGCWHLGGMTLGMRAWRIRIVGHDGNKPGIKASLIRFLASWLSIAVAGLGFFWSLADGQKRCWHDLLSKTRLLLY